SFSGGLSTGRTLTDNCEVAALLPESLGSQPLSYCHFVEPYLTQVKFLGSYVVPRVDVLVAATLQSAPGPQLAGNYAVTNAAVLPYLGRFISGTTTATQTTTVNIVNPGSLYGDRTNQLDLRFAKVVRYARTRTNSGKDL